MIHLERAIDGQNQWWKYLVIFLAAFFGAQIIGAIPLVAVVYYKSGQAGNRHAFNSESFTHLSEYGISAHLGLVLMIIPFIISLLALAVLLKPLHKRSLTETINGRNKIRWGRFFFAAAVWAALMAVCLAVVYNMNPRNFQFHFDISSFIPLVLISVILIPFQASFEEMLFRGYLAQGIAAGTRSRWLAIILPAMLFALMHGANPEVEASGFWLAMPQYVIFGLVFGLISTLDDGIEVAMGAHSANNVFACIFVTYKSAVIQTPALFNQLQIDPVQETLTLLISCIIFVAILAHKYKWKISILNKKVADPVTYPDAVISSRPDDWPTLN